MRELGFPSIAAAVAEYYGALLDGFVLDDADAEAAEDIETTVTATRTVMARPGDREALARDVLAFADRLAQRTTTD